jgi:hypothetical protein
MSEPPARPPLQSQSGSGPRIAAIVAVIVAAGIVLWLLLRARDDHGDTGKTTTTARATPPVLANSRLLRRLAASVRYPVYWAGRVSGRKVELTETSSGNIFLRYLTPRARVGDPRPDFLTVGTYPLKNAFAATRAVSERPGMIVRKLRGGGIAMTNPQRRTSVYFSFPRAAVQVEVYDPDPARAMRLVVSGRVRPIPAGR